MYLVRLHLCKWRGTLFSECSTINQQQVKGLSIASHYFRNGTPSYERGIITTEWRTRSRPRRSCRWCDERVHGRKRWHPDCLIAYTIARGESKTRNKNKVIDISQCALCGSARRVEVDHIVPLGIASLDGVRCYVRACSVDNLQALCAVCHARKSASDRVKIADKKRGQFSLSVE